MRAALRASINARAIYEAYQDTHPFVTDNITQDRTRARAWAMLHVKIDNEPIQAALKKIYTDGFLLGLDASTEAIGAAKKEYNKAAITKAKKKEESSDYVDWNNWKPGNRAAALLYRPTGAFEKLLTNAGITSKKIAANGFDRIGTALADSIAAGFSPARAAKVITEKIGDPARALTIAITEQNRAMSLAAMENYKNGGIEKVEWSGANPCDICAPNEGQVVNTGDAFESGDTEPPVHPNCRCAVLPVIDDAFYAEPSPTDGLNLLPSVDLVVPEAQIAPIVPTTIPAKRLSDAEYRALTNTQAAAIKPTLKSNEKYAVNAYKGEDFFIINRYLRVGNIAFGRGIKPERLLQRQKETNELINNLKPVINRTAPLTEPIIVYRGVQSDYGRELWDAGIGSEYRDKGFVSTSFESTKTYSFGSTRLEITVPAGGQGLAIDGLYQRQESEFLLQAGTNFRITGYDANPKDANSIYDRVIKVEVIL
jgi:SPP1 gp7 family putative phage head morphogenesis protein